MRVSEIRVKRIRVNQGLGVYLKVLGFLEKCLIFFYQGDTYFNC